MQEWKDSEMVHTEIRVEAYGMD